MGNNFKFGANNPEDPDNEQGGDENERDSAPPELIPRGRYMARVEDAQLGFTKKDVPQIAITFELLETGQRITSYRFFTEKALPYTVKDLRTLGWEGDDIASITKDDLQKDARIEVKHEEYPKGSGDWFARVAWINDPNENPVLAKPMDDDDKRKFGAEFKDMIQSIGKGGDEKSKPKDAKFKGKELVGKGKKAEPEPPSKPKKKKF